MAETTPVDTINLKGVKIWVKREDLNHPIIQGNKLHKLKHNLIAAKQQQAQTLITFGGAYSNHLLATAYAAQQAGLKSIGIVRGDELKGAEERWSDTLKNCQQFGMQLVFVSRADYRRKHRSETVQQMLDDSTFVIPEGGSNTDAVRGVADWLQTIKPQLNQSPTHIICPVGTGGTLAGIIAGCALNTWNCQVIGVAVLKGLHCVKSDINQWLTESNPDAPRSVNWMISPDYCGSGYGKLSDEMIRFGREFKSQVDCPLDKIYNIKSFYALNHMIEQGEIQADDRPLIIHTGGLQGGIV